MVCAGEASSSHLVVHHTLTIDHLKWPLEAVLITSPGLGVGAGPGPGAQPVGHVVQGRLQALHVLHQLHAQLLGPLLQSPPALNKQICQVLFK